MQLLLLKYREEIISAKVAKEHAEETMRAQVAFLKSQVTGEQQERATLEEALTQEISSLQAQVGKSYYANIVISLSLFFFFNC